MREWSLSLLLAFGAAGLSAKEAVPASADPVLEARMLRVAAELRCLVCQNQTIADSHSGLAEDLRREVRDQLRSGASEEQVVRWARTLPDALSDLFARKATSAALPAFDFRK